MNIAIYIPTYKLSIIDIASKYNINIYTIYNIIEDYCKYKELDSNIIKHNAQNVIVYSNKTNTKQYYLELYCGTVIDNNQQKLVLRDVFVSVNVVIDLLKTLNIKNDELFQYNKRIRQERSFIHIKS